MTEVKKLFKQSSHFSFALRNISINGQKRGCSGFILNKLTGKVAYITTEPFWDGGLWGNLSQSIMMRTAKHIKDYSGGNNQWLSFESIFEFAEQLTA